MRAVGKTNRILSHVNRSWDGNLNSGLRNWRAAYWQRVQRADVCVWDCERLAESTKCVSWLRPQFVAFVWQDTNVACDLGQTLYLLLCFLHHFHRYFPFFCLSRTVLRIPPDSSSPTKRWRVPSGFNTPFAFNCTVDVTHSVPFEKASSTCERHSNDQTSR